MSSYNFAVWEAEAPLSNTHAVAEYERLIEFRDDGPPTAAISRFIDKVEAEVAASASDGAAGPWAAPLLDQVGGPFLYFGVVTGREAEVATAVTDAAGELGLVAFDPQRGELLPSAPSVARTTTFELPAPAEVGLHLAAVMAEGLAAGGPIAGVVEHRDSGYYVQWLARDGTLLIEAQHDRSMASSHQIGMAVDARMIDLGFTEGDPNWSIEWPDGEANVEQAARLLGHVLTGVRGLGPGSPMQLQTFPV
ncbi:MAG: hypothetical protein AAF547_04825 [Actinomycetota bacterium]